jgi:hypothetical protein
MLGHDGLSGDAPVITPTMQLQYELNRYTAQNGAKVGSSGVDMAMFDAPLPVSGILDITWAQRAVQVLQSRAFYDGDTELEQRLFTDGHLNPLGYVTANLGTSLQIIKNYADTNGVPAASTPGSGVLDQFGSLSPTVLIIGGIAIYYLFLGKKR